MLKYFAKYVHRYFLKLFCLLCSLVFSSCSKEVYASYANKTVTCWIKPDDSEQSPGGYVLVDKPKLPVT